MKTVFLFSGQGSQYPGMGAELAEKSSAAKQILECGSDIMGFDLAKKLSEFSGMLSFLISCLLPVEADLRISLSVSYSCHCKVHSYFRAFSCEVCTKICKNIFADTLCNAYNVLSSPVHFAGLSDEFGSGSMADRTFFRSLFTFINITTYRTYEFHNFNPLSYS